MAQMPKLQDGQFSNGQWQGRVAAEAAPSVALTLNGEPLPAPTVAAAGDGLWSVSFPIPPAALSQGVHSFVLSDTATGARLATPAMLTGLPVEDDLRAEIALLRSELELVKRALRRLASE